jgi:hypothetical protein
MKHLPLVAVLLSLAWGCSDASPRYMPRTELAAAKPDLPPAQPPSVERTRRKVIYNATIELLVDRLPDAAASLDNLVA